MEMTTCRVCGKIFGAMTGSVCPSCSKLLDIVYDKARNYLRDNPKVKVQAKSLAEAINEDVKLVEMLVVEGRFDSNGPAEPMESESEKRRKKLLEELQKNLETPARREAQVTYGSSKHSRNAGDD
jgi:cell division septum initiation protein DivIVA